MNNYNSHVSIKEWTMNSEQRPTLLNDSEQKHIFQLPILKPIERHSNSNKIYQLPRKIFKKNKNFLKLPNEDSINNKISALSSTLKQEQLMNIHQIEKNLKLIISYKKGSPYNMPNFFSSNSPLSKKEKSQNIKELAVSRSFIPLNKQSSIQTKMELKPCQINLFNGQVEFNPLILINNQSKSSLDLPVLKPTANHRSKSMVRSILNNSVDFVRTNNQNQLRKQQFTLKDISKSFEKIVDLEQNVNSYKFTNDFYYS